MLDLQLLRITSCVMYPCNLGEYSHEEYLKLYQTCSGDMLKIVLSIATTACVTKIFSTGH